MSTKEDLKKDTNEQQDDQETYIKLSQLYVELEKKSKIEVRNATYGHSRSDYVRGKDLEMALTENLEWLCNQINKICKTNIDHTSPKSIQSVFKEFHKFGILYKAERPESEGRIKYPKRLIPLEPQDECCEEDHISKKKIGIDFHNLDSSTNSFYALNVIRSKGKTYFWLFVAIFGVIMACLFPVWPIEVKVGIWWVSYILLIFLIVLTIVRYIIYTFFYIFGVSLWIFPNLFDDSRGVIESFIPLYSFEKRQDSYLSILIRLIIAGFVSYTAWHVYTNPDSLLEFRDHLVEIYNDMFEFGKDKIVNYYNSTALHVRDKKYMNPMMDFGDDD